MPLRKNARKSTLSYQLSRLESKGAISSLKEGKKTYYYTNGTYTKNDTG
jgi:predicted transcriptional regulator